MTSNSPSFDTYLMHHGVKGMKWGVRKKSDGVKRSTKRKAKKDAKEFARAKMFYGEGAGNRRKLIKATVNQRSKDLKGYKNEFDKYYAKQDMSEHASKAKKERRRKDIKNSTTKTVRGLVNAAMGNIGRASAGAAAIYVVAHQTGIDKKIMNGMATSLKNAKLYVDMWNRTRRK